MVYLLSASTIEEASLTCAGGVAEFAGSNTGGSPVSKKARQEEKD